MSSEVPRRKGSAESSSDEGNHSVGRSGRFAYQGLDRVLHEKARLGILASLAASHDGVLFNDLKQLCSLTDGNLSRHLGVLSEAGLVEIWKGGVGSRPQTLYRLTHTGRQRFSEYISVLEKVVIDAQSMAQLPRSSVSGGFFSA